MVTRLALWTASECESQAARIFARRSDWISRHERLPSYTLGAAAYLDAPVIGPRGYALRARRTNSLLTKLFAADLKKLEWVLSAHLNAPVELSQRWAVPGFHIFLHHPRLAELTPSLHFDLQFSQLEWAEAAASPREDRLSFTALVQGPKSGAGLNIWPIRHDSVASLEPPEVVALSTEQRPEPHRYEVGELFVHDGDWLHQIDARYALAEGEARITLQGHGQKIDDRWVLYW